MLPAAASERRAPPWAVALLLTAAACGGGGEPAVDGRSDVHEAAVLPRAPRQLLGGDGRDSSDTSQLYLAASPIDVRAKVLPSGPARFKEDGEVRSSAAGRFGWRRTPDGLLQVEAANAKWYSRKSVGLLLREEAEAWSVVAVALHHWGDAGPMDIYRRIDVGSVFLDPDEDARLLRVAAAFGSDAPWPVAGSFSAELDLSLDGEGDEPRLPLAAVWHRSATAGAERALPADATRADRAAASAIPDVLRAVERGRPVVAVTPIRRGMRVDPETRAAVPADPPEFWARRAFEVENARVRFETSRLEDERPDPPDDLPAPPPDAWFLADGSLFVAFPGDDGLAYYDRGGIDLVLDRRPGDLRWHVRAVGLSYGNHTLPSLYDPVVDGWVRLDGDPDALRVEFALEGRVHGGDRFPIRGRFAVDLAGAERGVAAPVGNELAAAWEALVARVASEQSE